MATIMWIPPSAALFTTFTIMALLKAAGAFAITGVGSMAIAAVIAAAGYGIWTVAKRGSVAGEQVTDAVVIKA